jgi:polar amino acid transport system substrate-binding protein
MPYFCRIASASLLFMLASPAWSLEPLKLVSDENAPFASTDASGKAITGITFEMVQEAARRADIPIKTELNPWARAYWRAQNAADTCVYPVVRLPQRESLFQWIGPLSKNTWVLYAKADFSYPVDTLDDAKKYRVGGLLQDGPSTYLQAQGVNVELVGTNELNINKLAAGRIDLWATGYFRGKLVSNKASVPIKQVFVIQEVDHYMACNLKVPEQSVKAMNKAVEAMWQDGWMKRINESYQKRFLN